jgi:hypothetical protein
VPLGQEFALGGPLRLTSYALYELWESDYALASAGYIREIRGGALAKWYAIRFVQAGRVFHARSSDRSGLGCNCRCSGGYIHRPDCVGVSLGDAGHRKVFVSIGRLF